MSDVINGVLRDDLKSLLVAIEGTMWADAQWAARCRALLTAQPSAQAVGGMMLVPAEVHLWPLDDGVEAQQRAADVGCDRVDCLHDGLQAMLSIICKQNQAQPQPSAAQSAPAGEREEEAFEDQAKPLGFDLTVPRDGDYRDPETLTAWRWFQRGAAWQRTQSAGAPEGWRAHSVRFARGVKCPQSIETLQAAWERDQELILEQRAEISRLRQKLNQARQGMRAGFDLDAWLEFAADKQALIDEIDVLREQIAAAPAQPAVHPDDAAVDRFAAAMKAKLARARAKGRGGWDDPAQCSVEFLAKLLVEHLTKGNAGTFEDVANFAMMLHQRGADPQVLAREASAEAERLGAANEKLCARIKQLKAEPAAQDQGEVQRLRALICEASDELQDWRMSFPDANSLATDRLLERIEAALAASTGQEVKP